MEKTLDQLKVLIFCGIIIFIAQFVNLKGKMDMVGAVVGMIVLITIAVAAMLIKENVKLKVPAFAWASLLGLLLTTPWSPVQDLVLNMTKQYSTLSVSTCILAIAGISVGNKLVDIKKISWKIVVVAMMAFVGTFFGSALISEAILKFQGII